MTEQNTQQPTSTSDPYFLERVADHQKLAVRDIPEAGGVDSPDGRAILAARLELQQDDVPRLLANLEKAREYIDALFWVAVLLDRQDDDAGEPLRIVANDLEDLLSLPHRQWGSVEEAEAEAFATGNSGLAHAFEYYLGPRTVVARALEGAGLPTMLGDRAAKVTDEVLAQFHPES